MQQVLKYSNGGDEDGNEAVSGMIFFHDSPVFVIGTPGEGKKNFTSTCPAVRVKGILMNVF